MDSILTTVLAVILAPPIFAGWVMFIYIVRVMLGYPKNKKSTERTAFSGERKD